MPNKEKIKQICDEKFENHVAQLVQITDRFTIIDWRNKDGSSINYINFVVDKQRGSLIVSGDLGDSIATWFNPQTASKIKNFIKNDAGYYASKFQTSSHKYYLDAEIVLEKIKSWIADDEKSQNEAIETYAATKNYVDTDDFITHLNEQIEMSVINNEYFRPTEKLEDIVDDLCGDTYWLYEIQGDLHIMVYIWAEAFVRACDQLGL